MITLYGLNDVQSYVGREFGVSAWHAVTQEAIDTFADVTGDHQWIHTDPARAAQSPFGGTIAHGLYTLSLGPKFCQELFELDGFAFGMNYGYNKVRFVSPVPVGSRIRMRATLSEVNEVPGAINAVVTCTLEREGADKPVCVAENVFRMFTA